MPPPGFRKKKKGKRPFKTDISADDIQRFVGEVKAGRSSSYRERSLAIHGWICAKCGREFDRTNLHLLTVHHKDGDPQNNPASGINWENLCIDCHDDEHSRGILGDYLTEGR